MEIQLHKTHQHARIPQKGTELSAGYDLYASESGTINQNERKMIDTGIQIAIPKNYYGRIAPRSGLALKYGIDVLAGVIDADYRGNIKCILLNTGKDVFVYNIGDRIAQIIIEKHYDVQFVQMTNSISTFQVGIQFIESESINKTERIGGFGSTGV